MKKNANHQHSPYRKLILAFGLEVIVFINTIESITAIYIPGRDRVRCYWFGIYNVPPHPGSICLCAAHNNVHCDLSFFFFFFFGLLLFHY